MFTRINSVYANTNNISRNGSFDDKSGSNFKELLDLYLNAKTSEEEFINFSKQTCEIFKSYMSNKPTSTGGYLLVSHYKKHNLEELMIVMIKKSVGITIDDTLTPIDATDINLDKLHHAFKIRLSDYRLDGNDKKDQYLSFLARKNNPEVADYFTLALGCKDGTEDRKSTEDTINAVATYFLEHEELCDKVGDAKDEICKKMFECIDQKKEIVFENMIPEWLAHFFPEEKRDEHKANIVLHANSGEFNIAESFHPIKDKVKQLQKAKLKSENDQYTLEYRKSALGTLETSTIRFEEDHNELIIKLSEKEAEAIKKVLAEHLSKDEDEDNTNVEQC